MFNGWNIINADYTLNETRTEYNGTLSAVSIFKYLNQNNTSNNTDTNNKKDLIEKVTNKYSSVEKKELGFLLGDKEYIYVKLYEYASAGSPKINLVIVNNDAEEIYRETIKESGQSLVLEQNDSSVKLYANENYYVTTDAVFYLSNNYSCTNTNAKEYKITVNNNKVTKTEVATHTVTISGSCS